jgi:hypothetical protein
VPAVGLSRAECILSRWMVASLRRVFIVAMLIFYALEDRSPWYILAFAAACGLGSAYGFLQGSWPFGVIGAVWAGIALWRWRTVAGSV